jgi:hypothetical protein
VANLSNISDEEGVALSARLIVRLSLAAIALFLTFPVSATAGTGGGFETFEHTPNLQPLGSALREPPGGVFSDLAFWGDLAFQGSYDGFTILDISDPASPQEVSFTACSVNQGDVLVWDDLLIRSWNSPAPANATCDGAPVDEGFEGLHIFDISNTEDPTLISDVDLSDQNPILGGCGSHTATLVPDLTNNRVLVYNGGSNANCPWIDIVEIDLADAANPTELAPAITGRQCHDNAVILGDANLAVCAGGNGFTVLSIGAPGGGTLEAPEILYTKVVEPPNVTIGHAATFSWDGEILAFGHEPGGGVAAECTAEDAAAKKTLFFYEARTGTELGRWVLPRPQTATENCTLHNFNTVPSSTNNILVMGNYQAGISVVDFTDPSTPREIAYADPAPLVDPDDPEDIVTGGDWSSYWYDGEIYQSDITRGLLVWNLLEPVVAAAPTLGHLNPQTQETTNPVSGGTPIDIPGVAERCKGRAATMFGSAGNDVIKGTPATDIISVGNGRDKVVGAAGNDLICGGKDNDRLKGGKDSDRLLGQGGRDRLTGGQGPDFCKGGPKPDRARSCEKGKA